VLGGALADKGDPRARDLSRRLEDRHFVAEARIVQSRLLARQGNFDQAFDLAAEAIDRLRAGGVPLGRAPEDAFGLLVSLANARPELRARAVEAVARGPLALFIADNARRDAGLALASTLGGDPLCVRALGDDATQPDWALPVLTRRLSCLRAAGHPGAAQAEADLARYLGNTPGTLADRVAVP